MENILASLFFFASLFIDYTLDEDGDPYDGYVTVRMDVDGVDLASVYDKHLYGDETAKVVNALVKAGYKPYEKDGWFHIEANICQ